jgi:hypothetical protein
LRILDRIFGWLLVAFGLLHASLTKKVHPNLDIDAVWFACGGLFMSLIGVLNLLRVAYGAVARGVRVTSVIANFVVLAIMVFIATILPVRQNPQVAVGMILAVGLTVFSVVRREKGAER